MSNRLALFMTGLAAGGAERVMLTLAQGFVERGHNVDLVVCRAEGALRDEIPAGVRLVDLNAPRISIGLPALLRYLRRQRLVAMLSAMAPTNCLAIAARSISRTEHRLVVVEHSTLSNAINGSNNLRERVLPSLMRRLYPHADAVVAVSNGVADDLALTIGLPRNRINVIYNPVITPRLIELSHDPVDHPWFGPSQPPVILGVGRLTAAKDFPTLIRAFAMVRNEMQVRLIIVGEGEDRTALENLVGQLGLKEDIMLPGYMNNPYAYMRNAALFVLSSQWEGLGNVLIEAMACGTPVVSTDCPSGPREILDDGRLAPLIAVGDVDRLAIALLERLRSSDNLENMNEPSLEKFYASDVLGRYESIVSDQPGA